MGYTSYEFYQTEYFGDLIASADFDKWNARASQYIDTITSRRLRTAYPSDEYADTQIQLAVCELAEKMMQTDAYLSASAIQENGAAALVKSMTSGSESITYATGETVYAGIVKDEKSKNVFYHAAVSKYLVGIDDENGVHLLYQGV